MKIKNGQIKSLVELLSTLTLKGKEARMLGRFIKPLVEYNNEYFATEVTKLQNEYAIKNEDNQIVGFEQEYFVQEQILMNEEYIIELNESNKMIVLSVSEILLNGDFEINGGLASEYDDWCNEAERVIEYYQSIEGE